MTDNDTNPYLDGIETTPQVVKSGLRAWSEHLARKAGSRSRSRQRRARTGAGRGRGRGRGAVPAASAPGLSPAAVLGRFDAGGWLCPACSC